VSPFEVLSAAAGALGAQRRRTLLSLLGVAIGVACGLVLTGLGEGARRYATQQFESLGTRLLTVTPGRTETSGAIPGVGGAPNDLTLEDARAVERLPAARLVTPVSLGNETLGYQERSRQVLVIGTTPEMLPIRRLELRQGAFLPEGSWERGAPVAVIGAKLARELLGGQNPLGARVRLGGWRLRVAGVLEPRGMHLGIDLDEVVFVPVATALALFDQSTLMRVVVELRPGADLAASERNIERLLEERHGELDVTIITQDAVVGAVSSILGALTMALGGIAAVSLLVAGVGIMNVMLVSVSERTSEIGLLKAVGAAPRQVLAVFLTEAALISALGGALGLGLGWAGIWALRSTWPALPAAAPAWAVVSAGLLALLVGLLSGVLPARRAMRLDAVTALTGR